ncbi:MAG: hypothetical protein ACFCGT_18590 [Sandaracinaceae bacterium]
MQSDQAADQESDEAADDYINAPGVETSALDAVHLPEQGVLYAADTVAVRALLPAGGVSIFMPDYLAALERLEQLDFEVFVPGHFGWGTKADFVEAAQMQRDSWSWIREALERFPPRSETPVINDRAPDRP